MSIRNVLACAACLCTALFITARPASAFTVTGKVTATNTVQLGVAPVNTTTHQVLKIAMSTPTTGVALAFCAGSEADISAKKCTIQLGNANEVGTSSINIVDAALLNGKVLYVINQVGTVTAT
jgi:hypothetical protein